jgi:hypothetical protein
MDRRTVREWKAGYEAVNSFVDEERRKASAQERYVALKQIWEMARELGLLNPKPLDLSQAERWQRLRAAYARGHG